MIYDPCPFKRCSTCHQWKMKGEFSRNKSHWDGLQNQCHACDVKYRTDHPDVSRATGRRAYNNNIEKNREYSRRYRREHPDDVSASQARFRHENPDKLRVKEWKREARRLSLPHDFSKPDWDRAIAYFHGTCAYCGKPPKLWDVPPTLHQDHYVSQAKGGGYTLSNIVPACQNCNCSKQERAPEEWLTDKFGARRAKQIITRIQVYFAGLTTNA